MTTIDEIRKVVRDTRIKDIIAQCGIDEPGSIGECVETQLIERLVEAFAEPALVPVTMQEWIETDPTPDDDETCRPCALPITLRWYVDVLREQGHDDLSAELEKVGLSEDPLTVAVEMDKIKLEVDTELHNRLVEFDATTQINVG